MDNNNDIILTDFETGILSLSKNSDLNNIFNFTYNFDLLKDVLSTIIKNQVNLKNQIHSMNEKYRTQSQIIESTKNEIIEIKQSQMEKKETFKITEEDFNKINKRIDNFEKQILKINEELDKSKFQYYNKIYFSFI